MIENWRSVGCRRVLKARCGSRKTSKNGIAKSLLIENSCRQSRLLALALRQVTRSPARGAMGVPKRGFAILFSSSLDMSIQQRPIERRRCQIASDAGRAMRTTKPKSLWKTAFFRNFLVGKLCLLNVVLSLDQHVTKSHQEVGCFLLGQAPQRLVTAPSRSICKVLQRTFLEPF